jgi:endoglucanase
MNDPQGLEARVGARLIVPLRFFRAAVVLAAAVFFAAQANYSQSDAEASVARRHASHLQHGINLSEWFAQVYDEKGYTREHFGSWTTVQDIDAIKSMGFDHVRLSVNPQPMFRRGQADRIPEEYIGYLDAAVQMIQARGLAVIIDVHPESDFKQKLTTGDGFVEQFADYWRALARHYASTNPELVSFES